MKLDEIGFYTLSEERAKHASIKSPLARAELIITDKCNLRCPYCKGLKNELKGDLSKEKALYILDLWIKEGLKNVRFSGGEPTIYPYLKKLVSKCKNNRVERIAISTNGTADESLYAELLALGVNDFSISLDSGCCSIGEVMTGGNNTAWYKAVDTIKNLSKKTYVSVGVVFTEINYKNAVETIKFIDKLGVSDIRIIPSAQYNKSLKIASNVPDNIKKKYKILNYRINNFRKDLNVRGLMSWDCNKCYLVVDDVACAGDYHYPCIIYLREGGNPIGKINENFRQDRYNWYSNHDTQCDKICKKNCLDVCIKYNNTVSFNILKGDQCKSQK